MYFQHPHIRHSARRFTWLVLICLACCTSMQAQQLHKKPDHTDSTSVHEFMKKVRLTHKKKQDHKKHHPKPPTQVVNPPAVVTNPSGTKVITSGNPVLTQKVLNPHYDIFGWHPYWMTDAYLEYDFKLLSHIAYFSYEVDPSTGQAETYHDWLTTPMIDSAKASNPNCKILLTITCFGSDENTTFLGNTTAQLNAANSILSLIQQRDADGVNIDFEGVPSSMAAQFTTFLQQFATALHKKGYILTLAIPAVDYNDVFNIAALEDYVDLFILMGYGYYGSYSSKPGPIAPLVSSRQWGAASIDSSVVYYLGEGMSKNKLVVGLPYYAGYWQSQTDSHGNDSVSFVEYYTYTTFMDAVDGFAELDTVSVSAYSEQMKGTIYQYYWGEDTSSLSLKMDWIISNDLQGMGIWALGYDNGRDELWDLLAKKFGSDSVFTIPPDTTGHGSGTTACDTAKVTVTPLQSAMITVNKYPYSILFALLVVFLAALTGYLSLYFNEDTAELLRQKGLYYTGLITCFVIFNALVIIALYLTYGLPILLLVIYSLLTWCLGLLGYYLIYDALHKRDIP